MFLRQSVILGAILLLFAGCTSPIGRRTVEQAGTQSTFNNDPTSLQGSPVPEFDHIRIRLGDTVKLTISRKNRIVRIVKEFYVGSHGIIDIPFLGEYLILGKGCQEASREIACYLGRIIGDTPKVSLWLTGMFLDDPKQASMAKRLH